MDGRARLGAGEESLGDEAAEDVDVNTHLVNESCRTCTRLWYLVLRSREASRVGFAA